MAEAGPIRQCVERWLGDRLLGALDFVRHPEFRTAFGGPFNGQAFRQRIFEELLELVPFAAIIETGTCRGTTTEFLARRSGRRVYTVEAHPRYFGYSRARFLWKRRVSLTHGDSRRFLRKLAEAKVCLTEPVFFYLDAHWQEDLPLGDEIRIILDAWQSPVVMVDDFQVPDDTGYAYDRYGPGQELTLSYLEALHRPDLVKFFPTTRSAEETGAKRGCVVLAATEPMLRRLRTARTLREWKNGSTPQP